VVVHDFNVERIGVTPYKANAVLIVDADAVLTFAVFRQRFKMVSAWNCQVREAGGPMQNCEFLQGGASDVSWNAPAFARIPKQFSIGVFEALDQEK
jgi:hypothetical protein